MVERVIHVQAGGAHSIETGSFLVHRHFDFTLSTQRFGFRELVDVFQQIQVLLLIQLNHRIAPNTSWLTFEVLSGPEARAWLAEYEEELDSVRRWDIDV